MKEKGFAQIILFLLIGFVSLIVLIFVGIYFLNILGNQQASIETPVKEVPFKVNNSDLIFLTSEDKKKIFDAIDSVKSIEEFDKVAYETYADILDSYDSKRKPNDPFVISPEFMSDHPGSVVVIKGERRTDLLEGLDLKSLTIVDLPDLKEFGKIFFEEYTKYPLAWLDYTTPPTIVFVRSVKVRGEVAGGVETGAIVYNISSVDDKEFTRKLIHHELMHWIVTNATRTENDPAWPESFNGYSQKIDLNADYNFLEHPKPGFVTGYAQSNADEDKAETYAYLFTADGLRKLSIWEKTDELLKKKVDYIKNLIKKRVAKMDDSYFNKYIAGN